MTATVTVDTDNISVTYASQDPDGHLDLDQAISDLHDLRETVTALRMWEGVLTDWIADALGRNTLDLDGIGHIEVKHGANRKEWDNDALWRLVVARARDERKIDPETGEALESEGEAVGRVLGECMRPSWRLTPLRERDIDPDEYCQVSPGKTSVVIS